MLFCQMATGAKSKEQGAVRLNLRHLGIPYTRLVNIVSSTETYSTYIITRLIEVYTAINDEVGLRIDYVTGSQKAEVWM
ncbi:hypothetical protein RRG08_010647 [Elysia crispata]|uniref:Uncharacterized protein n=1 Tax=Elysia crispata TaxID=231223 RepID=A0AAE0Z0P0_9GAST|nr:hypothetical protein RRG08_010647 [Elysia crispata]